MERIENMMGQLRLGGMSQNWRLLMETRRVHELSLVDGLELLLQSEKQERENRKFNRLHKKAQFRYRTLPQEINHDAARGLDKSQLTSLLKGDYIANGESVLITGSTGCGKSFLASALGHQACSQGYTVAYYSVQKLLSRLKVAKLDGTISKAIDKIAKINLLILDDFGLSKLDKQQQLDFMEIFEDRHMKNATIMVSQLPVSAWYEIIGEETIADAILDRLVHTSHRIELKGDSLRKKR